MGESVKVAICTTTINKPTKALGKFAQIAEERDWGFFIAGDLKTPHREYHNDSRWVYLNPESQMEMAGDLSELIGWNCIQRRNFAMLAAYRAGYDVLALIDDDNEPVYSVWGRNVYVGRTEPVLCSVYDCGDLAAFEPIGHGRDRWHRGFPVQLLDSANKQSCKITYENMIPLIQADMWAGEPDLDAISRISGVKPDTTRFTRRPPYRGSVAGPFNSQNTFIHRSVLPTYFLFPGIGRMDDIWTSYITQKVFPNRTVYGGVTVYQDRNEHDFVKDLDAEMIGYRHTIDLVEWLRSMPEDIRITPKELPGFFPCRSVEAWREWIEVIGQPEKTA